MADINQGDVIESTLATPNPTWPKGQTTLPPHLVDSLAAGDRAYVRNTYPDSNQLELAVPGGVSCTIPLNAAMDAQVLEVTSIVGSDNNVMRVAKPIASEPARVVVLGGTDPKGADIPLVYTLDAEAAAALPGA